jgi:hypothetical protein
MTRNLFVAILDRIARLAMPPVVVGRMPVYALVVAVGKAPSLGKSPRATSPALCHGSLLEHDSRHANQGTGAAVGKTQTNQLCDRRGAGALLQSWLLQA